MVNLGILRQQLLFVFIALLSVLLNHFLVLVLEDVLDFLLRRRHVLLWTGTLGRIEILRQVLRDFLLDNFHSFFYEAI